MAAYLDCPRRFFIHNPQNFNPSQEYQVNCVDENYVVMWNDKGLQLRSMEQWKTQRMGVPSVATFAGGRISLVPRSVRVASFLRSSPRAYRTLALPRGWRSGQFCWHRDELYGVSPSVIFIGNFNGFKERIPVPHSVSIRMPDDVYPSVLIYNTDMYFSDYGRDQIVISKYSRRTETWSQAHVPTYPGFRRTNVTMARWYIAADVLVLNGYVQIPLTSFQVLPSTQGGTQPYLSRAIPV